MRRLRLILDFVKFSVHEKIAFFLKVINNMTENPTFPSPDVPMRTALAAVEQLQKDYIAAQNGGKAATAAMHESDQKATDIFRKLADYVDRTANGDEVIILSSGFNISKERAAIRKAEFSVNFGEKSGTVSLKRQAVEGARSYLWQYYLGDIPSDEKGWTFAGASTRANYVINGLAISTKYWFRVAAVTVTGTTDYCSPVCKVVL